MTLPGMPFTEAVERLVAEAREIIRDGSADDLTADDLENAERALRGYRTKSNVAALAEVAALGAEYLLTVGRDLEYVAWAGGKPEFVASLVREHYRKNGERNAGKD